MKRIKYQVSFDFYMEDAPGSEYSTRLLGYLIKTKIRLMRSITSIRNFKISRVVR